MNNSLNKFLSKHLLTISILGVSALMSLSMANAADSQRNRSPRNKPVRGQFNTSSEARAKAAIEYYFRGMELEANQDIPGALAQYDTALFYDSKSNDVRMAFIRVAASMGKFQAARDAAGKLELTDIKSLQVLVDLYRQAQLTDSVLFYLDKLTELDTTDFSSSHSLASYYEQQGDLISAIPYREKVANQKGDYQSYNELGALQFLTGDYPAAIKSFEKAIELEPGAKNIPSYSGLSDALSEIGNPQKQREVLGQLLALDSNHIPSHRRLIDYYSRQRLYDSALTHSKAEVELNSQDKSAIKRLGIIAYSADSLDLAEEQFNELLAIGEVDFSNYFFLGRIFLEKGNYPYALINFRTAANGVDSISDGWLGIAQTYLAMDSLPQAANTYLEALNSVKPRGDRVRLLFALGAVREQLGEIKLAEETFLQVLELDSLNAPAMNYLGYTLVERNERLPYAKGLIERALQINPNSGAYIDSYAWALYQEGNFEAARDSLHRSLELINFDPTVYDHLGDTFDKLMMPDSAKVYWRRALERDSANVDIKEKLNR